MKILAWGAVISITCASAVNARDPGPFISFPEAVKLGNAAIHAKLAEHGGAIEWPYQPRLGFLKGALGKTKFGYWTCGLVNMKDKDDTFIGDLPFLFMFQRDAVSLLRIGDRNGADEATITCNIAVQKKELLRAPTLEQNLARASVP